MSQNAGFLHDASHVPITQLGLTTTDSQTLTANNTTAHVPIFGITGTILVNSIYGVVTTTLGANNTAAYWRLNDQTNQSNITVNTGTTLSGAVAGSTIIKKGLASAALTLLSASQEQVSEPTTLETLYFSPFVVQQLPTAATNIEFTYTTTDTPTSGAITFYLCWVPLSVGATVAAL